jgi:hypothetical protein
MRVTDDSAAAAGMDEVDREGPVAIKQPDFAFWSQQTMSSFSLQPKANRLSTASASTDGSPRAMMRSTVSVAFKPTTIVTDPNSHSAQCEAGNP